MSFKPNSNGPATPRRVAGPADEGLKWPVLARLPLVGGGVSRPSPVRTSLPAPMTLAESVAAPAPAPAPAPRTQRSQNLQRRSYIDPAHDAVRGYDGPPLSDAADAPAAIVVGSPSASRRRIDGPRRPLGAASVAPAESRLPEGARPTLAAQLFQLHAKAAPHAGVLATAAMMLAAGVLCWLTFGQSHPTISYGDALQLPGHWPAERTTQAPAAANDETSASETAQGFIREFSWHAGASSDLQVVATPPTPTPPLQLDVSAAFAAAAKEPVDSDVVVALPAPTSAPDAGSFGPITAPLPPIGVTSADESIVPTPLDAYPSTVFTNFEPLDVAGRSAEAPAPAPR